MTGTLLVAWRELLAQQRSVTLPALFAAVLLVDGLLFYAMGLGKPAAGSELLERFFWWTSGVHAVAGLVLGMRTLAEERQQGSLPVLLGSPLRHGEIVAGKYLACLAQLGGLAVASSYLPAILLVEGGGSVGHLLVGYLGHLAFAGTVAAIAVFASAVGRTPALAGLLGAALTTLLLVLWMLARVSPEPLDAVLASLALHHENFAGFQAGVLRLGPLVYYLGVVYVFLLAAAKALEAQRWR